ncbi:hypothetical protein WN51_03489 [Melipona quadrifasciata]|uniref:Uncharacterized protein n=1 Tax=Melipona quadrifasciata TaxID=166423 RepID=A0A0M8ZU87_9HYME|nr:hypothetical protein WN51_03489 [Melipona quadrifasciata]
MFTSPPSEETFARGNLKFKRRKLLKVPVVVERVRPLNDGGRQSARSRSLPTTAKKSRQPKRTGRVYSDKGTVTDDEERNARLCPRTPVFTCAAGDVQVSIWVRAYVWKPRFEQPFFALKQNAPKPLCGVLTGIWLAARKANNLRESASFISTVTYVFHVSPDSFQGFVCPEEIKVDERPFIPGLRVKRVA